jgi:hypothetical protein
MIVFGDEPVFHLMELWGVITPEKNGLVLFRNPKYLVQWGVGTGNPVPDPFVDRALVLTKPANLAGPFQ